MKKKEMGLKGIRGDMTTQEKVTPPPGPKLDPFTAAPFKGVDKPILKGDFGLGT